jgi:arabinan endo-1,5-alpha-L-arabinosidase
LLIFVFLGAFILFGCASEGQHRIIQSDYQNPIRIRQADGTYKFTEIADPDVIRGDDGYFYFYSTATYVEHPQRGRFFDLCPIFQSKDLVNWEYKGSVFTDQVYDEKEFGIGFNIWAPSLIKINGIYYCYYSIAYGWYRDETGIGVATSPTPYGPWTHYGRLFTSQSIGVQNSIDPFVIEDGGKLHIIWGSYLGIYGAELSIDGLEILPSTKKEIIPGKDFLDNYNNYEATYIVKRREILLYGFAG